VTYLPTKVIKRARYRLKCPVNSAGRPPSSLVLRHRGLLLGWGLVRDLIFSFPRPKTTLRYIIVEK
jgi:hypothetical protein